ncbi:MAG: hypothetical protein KGJ36_08115 [Acidobacteriota bacterium]|nr:hypothetical protein [Acidobacteriota bacterium]
MSVRGATWIVGLVLYAGLWVVAANGATSLVAPLAIPAVLALLVFLGLRLNRFLGLSPRSPKFDDGEDDPGE